MRRAVVPPRAGGRREGTCDLPSRARGRHAPAAKPAEPVKPSGADDGLVGVVALVFDQLGPDGARNARAAALQFAGRSFPKGSLFSVYKVGQGLQILQAVHRGPEEPPRGDREGDEGDRPGPRPGAARGVRQRHGGGLLHGPRRASRREGPRSRRAVHGDAGPDAPLHRLRDARGAGPGLAPAAPRDRARALSRPGSEVPPLLLRGPHRPAGRRGPLPDDREHGQPVERLGLRVRRAGAARPLAVGGDEAGTRPRPRHGPLRSGQRRHARRGRADDGDRALGDVAGRAPAQPAGRPAGPRREHGRLPRGGDERPAARARARGGRPARLLRGRLRPAQPEGRRTLARDLGQGLAPGRRRPHAPRLLRDAAGRAGRAALRDGPRRGPRGAADAAGRRAPRRHAALRGRRAGDRDAPVGRGPARGADPHPRRDHLPRPREPARPGQGREGDARRAPQPRDADRRAARRAGGGAAADDGREENAAPPAGTIRPRDGGPGPGERPRRRAALRVRDPDARPGPEPGQRRDRARRRGGFPRHERSAPGGPPEGDTAPRSRRFRRGRRPSRCC